MLFPQLHANVQIRAKMFTIFFLKCPRYTTQRKDLLKTVCLILMPGVNPSLIVHLAGDILIQYFIHGNRDLSDDVNIVIFEAAQQYIVDTRRFPF